MRNATTVLTLLVLLTASAWSQSIPQHPATGYTHIGTFTASVPTPGSGGVFKATNTTDKSGVASEICVFRGGAGEISYIVNATTVRAENDEIDALSTEVIFDLLVNAAVEQGSLLGYATSGTVSVLNDACVTRNGFGVDTRLNPCTHAAYRTRHITVNGSTIN